MKTNYNEDKVNVYEIVTCKILELLEQGIIPWNEPYLEGSSGMPMNLITGKPYRGINRWLLWHRFDSPYYLTLKQVLGLGGRVKREEFTDYQIVTYYDIKDIVNRETKEVEKRFFLRYYKVYNVTQCTGLKHSRLTVKDNGNHEIAKPVSIVKGMPNKPTIKHDSPNGAYYHPVKDEVHIGTVKQFKTNEAYHATLFHELVHSTGHGSRLDRDLTGERTKEKYSREELIAEFGAAYLCELSGIGKPTIKNSAAYIQHWKQFLTEDPKAVVVAASRAEKACDYILGEERENN